VLVAGVELEEADVVVDVFTVVHIVVSADVDAGVEVCVVVVEGDGFVVVVGEAVIVVGFVAVVLACVVVVMSGIVLVV